jgi:hypothetical protein
MLEQSLILEPGTEDMFNELAQFHNVVDSYDNSDHIDINARYFRTSYSSLQVLFSQVIVRRLQPEFLFRCIPIIVVGDLGRRF